MPEHPPAPTTSPHAFPEEPEFLDPDDHRFSRPNMVRFLRDLKERDPDRFHRIKTMRWHHRAAYGTPDGTRLAGAVMISTPKPKRQDPNHPPRLVHPPIDGRFLLESEALDLIQPTSSSPLKSWSSGHWSALAKEMGNAKLPEAYRPVPAKDELVSKWRKLLRRAEDHSVLDPAFAELLKDQWSRWLDLRKDEADRFRLPALKGRTFPVEDPEAWKQAWEPWMERFQEKGRSADPGESRASDSSSDKPLLGVALVPVTLDSKSSES